MAIVSVKPSDVKIGMYVVSFEGSWFSHPFWRRHFVLASQSNVDRIIEAGTPVCIDLDKSNGVLENWELQRVATGSVASKHRVLRAPGNHRKANVIPFGRADRACAVELARRSEKVVKAMFEECRLGGDVPIPQLLTIVDEIADALGHDTSTFIAVTRLKTKDDYTYTHSVAVCALMISLARGMGYGRDQTRDLGMAGLLHDLGKLRIPTEVLKKPDCLTSEETAEMRCHPEYGREMLGASLGVPKVVLDVCLHHHERLDGSGYPAGLTGASISKAVRISSICDAYDAMTSMRPCRKGLAPSEAIEQLAAADGHFDSDLLFQLMVGIGIYPANTLVRLRSNRLAIALPLKNRSAKTVFRAFYSTVDTQFIPYEEVIPGDTLAGDRPVTREDPSAWFSADWPLMVSRLRRGQPALRKASSIIEAG